MNDPHDNAADDREMLRRHPDSTMTGADSGAIWQLVQEALHGHAEQLRRDAAGRKNAGEHLAGYRARLREERQLALAVEEMVNGIDPATLTAFLIISRSRPQEHPGGPELWAVGDSKDADRRAWLWSRAGHPYHAFSGGEHEKMCRVCAGDRDGIQHADNPAGRRAILQKKPKQELAALVRHYGGQLSHSAYMAWAMADLVDAVMTAEFGKQESA
jgi:hypothetical protein